MTRSSLQDYLFMCEAEQALIHDPYPAFEAGDELRLAAQLCLAICERETRTKFKRQPRPTQDQCLEVACALIDAGWPIEDERVVELAWLLGKSKITLQQLARVASAEEV